MNTETNVDMEYYICVYVYTVYIIFLALYTCRKPRINDIPVGNEHSHDPDLGFLNTIFQ